MNIAIGVANLRKNREITAQNRYYIVFILLRCLSSLSPCKDSPPPRSSPARSG